MIETRATMHGIPGDSARKRGLCKVLIPILIFGLLFGFAAGLLLGSLGLLPWWVGIFLLVGGVIGFSLFKLYQPSLVYGYFKGARGEEMVAGELARLPATWTIFNGLLLPNELDIDHVAVGPQGIFIIETKHWSGDVAIHDGQLLANNRRLSKSPIAQVRNLTSAICELLPQYAQLVHGVLCFAGPQFMAGAQQLDEVKICSYLNLSNQLTSGNIVLDAAEITACVAHLGTLSITQGL
ncbi:MAG: NERD domain-containing protein [Kiritimatiellae bacterium]|nr:NERD domain-containing protein [Kiritimatiellia bacterium]